MARLNIEIDLNEMQEQTFRRMRKALAWSDEANITIRRDGADLVFEADWIRNARFIRVPESA